MAPFEALYGRRCMPIVGWFEVGESSILCLEIIHDALDKVRFIREGWILLVIGRSLMQITGSVPQSLMLLTRST